MTFSTLKRPSALIPLAMSFAALSLVVGHTAIYGVTHETDEGTAAHLWQVLMAAQIPVIAVFAITWLSRSPRQALMVLVLQAVAFLAAAAPVFLLRL
jgi:cytochrome bd-type quinol oxidase subunit 2